MTGKWNLGRLAAIGGLTASTALLTGLGPVHADELADLRANQQLLQQRIDQLAQMQAQAPPAPGTQGGVNYYGGGFDPKLHLFVANVNNLFQPMRVVKKPDGTYANNYGTVYKLTPS